LITVGLDFDGLIGDLCRYFFGGAQYAAWRDAIGIVPGRSGARPRWADPVVMKAFTEAHTDPKSPLYLQAVPDALPMIRELLADGFTLPVITARDEEGAELAAHWLRAQGVTLPFEATHQDGTKLHALLKRSAVAHVDDMPSMLRDLHPDIPYRFLFGPGNFRRPLPEGLIPVRTWRDDLAPALRALIKNCPVQSD